MLASTSSDLIPLDELKRKGRIQTVPYRTMTSMCRKGEAEKE
jgi:hypothetical protein